MNAVKLLLRYGADIHMRNDKPYRLAIKAIRIDMIQLLLAQETPTDLKRQEFIDYAKGCGKENIVPLFT